MLLRYIPFSFLVKKSEVNWLSCVKVKAFEQRLLCELALSHFDGSLKSKHASGTQVYSQK